MAKRKSLSLKARFEVFKRDNFTCQYCGKSAPETVLHVDHIVPISGGGDNEILNLITSCFDCNMGKKARELGDDAVLKKQESEIAKLFAKSQEIQAVARMRSEIKNLDRQMAEMINGSLRELTNGKFTYSEYGIKKALKLSKKFGIEEHLLSLSEAFGQYYDPANPDSFERANEMVSKIARCRKLVEEKPYMRKLFYIRGIARNRFNYLDERYALEMLEAAHLKGASLSDLDKFTLNCQCWSQWRNSLESYIEGS